MTTIPPSTPRPRPVRLTLEQAADTISVPGHQVTFEVIGAGIGIYASCSCGWLGAEYGYAFPRDAMDAAQAHVGSTEEGFEAAVQASAPQQPEVDPHASVGMKVTETNQPYVGRRIARPEPEQPEQQAPIPPDAVVLATPERGRAIALGDAVILHRDDWASLVNAIGEIRNASQAIRVL